MLLSSRQVASYLYVMAVLMPSALTKSKVTCWATYVRFCCWFFPLQL